MTSTGRTLGLDVGDRRIGVAVTDPLGIIAQPLRVISRSSLSGDIAAIKEIADEWGAVRIVAGIPLNQEGKRGPQAQKVIGFLEELKKALEIDIVTQDERFTTAEAERALISADVRRKQRRTVIDKVAAQYILQTYLDRQAAARAENRV